MIKIGVCDDLPQDREQITKYLKKWAAENEIEVELTEYESGEDFLQNRNEDILFLDIEMEETDGISVKNQLQKEQMETRIIFVTSHQEMIEEAFGKQVFGFLTKPINYKKLKDKLETVLEDINDEYRVLVTGSLEERCVYTEQIMYIKANGKYCDICLENQERLFSDKNIGAWVQELESRGFYYCHRSYLVNLYHMRRAEDGIILTNGEKIPLSRRAKSGLKTAYRDYIRRKAR